MRGLWSLLIVLAALVPVASEWMVWPSEAEVPVGASVRVDMATGQRWIEVNTTEAPQLLGGARSQEVGSPRGMALADADLDAAFRQSVERATRAEDPSSGEAESSTPAQKILAALGRLPEQEQTRLAQTMGRARLSELSEAELASAWESRQAELATSMAARAEPSEVLRSRLEVLRDFEAGRVSEARVLDELIELDYDLSDLDEARDFHHALKGLETLEGLLKEGYPAKVRAAAAAALGTAVKNDEDLSNIALEAAPTLLSALGEADVNLRRKALYALGALVRNHPLAVRTFVREDGFGRVARALETSLADLPAAWPVADKAATLLGDLAHEMTDAAEVCQGLEDAIRRRPPDARLERFLKAAMAFAQPCADAWGTTRFSQNLDTLASDLQRGAGDAYILELAALATSTRERLDS